MCLVLVSLPGPAETQRWARSIWPSMSIWAPLLPQTEMHVQRSVQWWESGGCWGDLERRRYPRQKGKEGGNGKGPSERPHTALPRNSKGAFSGKLCRSAFENFHHFLIPKKTSQFVIGISQRLPEGLALNVFEFPGDGEPSKCAVPQRPLPTGEAFIPGGHCEQTWREFSGLPNSAAPRPKLGEECPWPAKDLHLNAVSLKGKRT